MRHPMFSHSILHFKSLVHDSCISGHDLTLIFTHRRGSTNKSASLRTAACPGRVPWSTPSTRSRRTPSRRPPPGQCDRQRAKYNAIHFSLFVLLVLVASFNKPCQLKSTKNLIYFARCLSDLTTQGMTSLPQAMDLG